MSVSGPSRRGAEGQAFQRINRRTITALNFELWSSFEGARKIWEGASGPASGDIVSREDIGADESLITISEGAILRVLRKSSTVSELSDSGIEGCFEKTKFWMQPFKSVAAMMVSQIH
jgi:hypothetical protein